MSVTLKHGDHVVVASDYNVGDIVKFEFTDKYGEARTSYSKIVKVVPKFVNGPRVNINFVTENKQYIQLKDIKELIRKAE